MEYAIGIDIGGTNTKLGIVSKDGQVIKRHEFKTTDFKDFPTYISALNSNINLINKDISGTCIGIGIGAPDANYYDGTIVHAFNLPFPNNVPFTKTLKELSKMENISITNDANAAALGEKFFGGGKDLDHFLVITLGTGLGSGIIIDGNLVYGSDGMAGELGHICAIPNGRICGCEKRGCLETYVSATGIKRTFFEMLAKYNGKSSLKNLRWDDIDAKVIEDAANAGDLPSIETYNFTAEILGRCLADFALFSSPSKIFLFGGPVKSGDLLIKPTKIAMEENLIPNYRGKIELLPSLLPMADAAILGAASLAWQNLI